MNNDLISRKAAIERFTMTAPQMSVIHIYETVEILESMPPAQQWIPCSEELPKNEEYVWAVYKNSLFPNGKSHHKTLKYDGEMWIDENGYRYLPANVTHWKYRDPLPEPYKEAANDD